MKHSINKYWIYTLFWLLIFSFMIWRYVDNHLNTDMSSELMLGKILNRTGEIMLSKRWFYSTELRTINIQMIVAGMFNIMASWHRIRTITSVIIAISVIACSSFCFYQLGYKKWVPILSAILIMPFSSDYFIFSLEFLHNTVHNLVPLILLGMFFGQINNLKSDNKTSKMWRVIFALFSFVTTLDGLRMMLVLYIPLLMCSAILRAKKIISSNVFLMSILCFFSSMGGYLVNSRILSRIYRFQPHEDIVFVPFSLMNFSDAFKAWLLELGFNENSRVFSLEGAFSVFSLFLVALIVISCFGLVKNIEKISKKEAFLTSYYICGFSVFMLVSSFCSMEHNARYTAPIAIFSFVIILMYLKNIKDGIFTNDIISFFRPGFIFTALILIVSFSSLNFYHNYATTNENVEEQQLAELMEDRGITKGYGGYWIANKITEYTNGEIEFWLLTPDHITDPRYTLCWLQDYEHFEKMPVGKVCYLLTKQEYEENNVASFLNKNEATIELQNYLVFEFDSADDLYSILKVKTK